MGVDSLLTVIASECFHFVFHSLRRYLDDDIGVELFSDHVLEQESGSIGIQWGAIGVVDVDLG